MTTGGQIGGVKPLQERCADAALHGLPDTASGDW